MRGDGRLHVLSQVQDSSDTEISTTAMVNKIKKNNKKARLHIVLNVKEEPATYDTNRIN